jgi:peptidoglycan LD-endopeptidase LytH
VESYGVLRRHVVKLLFIKGLAFFLLLPGLVILGFAFMTVVWQTNSTSQSSLSQTEGQPGVGAGANAIPKDLLPIYQQAGQKYGIPWSVLAAIHKRETNFGRTNGNRQAMISSANALGPMQFLPATFKQYGVDGNGDGKIDIWNEVDAIYSAANMLSQHVAANKKNPKKASKPLDWAIWGYNHAWWYVEDVLTMAKGFEAPAPVNATPALAGGKMSYPLTKVVPVTSEFGNRFHPIQKRMKFHAGIDLGCPSGTPVLSTENGVVSIAQWAGGYGYLVEVQHANGMRTRYGHLSKIQVHPGQSVAKGEQIALSGNTGGSTGAHLHYEVRINGTPQNPRPYLGL